MLNNDMQMWLDNVRSIAKFDPRGTPLPTTHTAWFFEGMKAPIHGIRLLTKHGNLIWYFVIPIIVQVIVSLALIGLLYLVGSHLVGWVDWLFDWANGAEATSKDESGRLQGFAKFSVWIGLLVAFGLSFFVIWRLTGGIVTGYFGGLLTDKAIQSAGLQFDERRHTSMVGELANGAFHAGLLAIPQPLFGAIAMLPIIGPPISIFSNSCYAIFVTGYGELRDPLEKMGLSRAQAAQLCIQCRAATAGLGIVKLLSEPLPLVGGVVQASESLGRISLALRMANSQPLASDDGVEQAS